MKGNFGIPDVKRGNWISQILSPQTIRGPPSGMPEILKFP